MPSQVNNLILILANKLAIIIYKAGMQYSLIRVSNFQTRSMIRVLFLQIITQSRIRLAANNLVLVIIKDKNLSQTLSLI
jgi:hypothetical protein